MRETTTPPAENPFLNLIVNILLPVLVLNKGSKLFDPRLALAIALAFPLLYGAFDYYRRRHKNYLSLIGIFNILLTGSLVILNLNGMWFAVKDACLPAVLGLVVLLSARSRTPAARVLFCNPQIMDMQRIEDGLTEHATKPEFAQLLERVTVWLSGSFFISAIGNFFLARSVFEPIDPALESHAQTLLLNAQIARMTWMGFAIIALPLMVFSGVLVYRFMRDTARLTGIPLGEILKTNN